MKERRADHHREPIIWEEGRHEIEKVVIVLPEADGLQSHLGEYGLHFGGEFPSITPVL